MRSLIIACLLMGLAYCASAQTSDILWARFGFVPAGEMNAWLATSTARQKIYTSNTGGSEQWPLSYSEEPARAIAGRNFLDDVSTWPGGKCPPHMPAGDSSLIFYNGGAFGEWYPRSCRTRLILADTIDLSSIDISPDGSLIEAIWATTTTSNDDSLHVLDRRNGTQLWSISLQGDDSRGQGGIARFSPDGKLLLSSMQDRHAGLVLIDVATHSIIHRYGQFLGPANSIAWDPAVPGRFVADGAYFCETCGNSALMDTSGQVVDSGEFAASSGEFNDLDFSPDGKYIVAGGAFVYRVADGQTIQINDPFHVAAEPFDAEFLNNDTFVVVGNGNVSLFSVSQQSYLRTISGSAFFLAFSGNGALLNGNLEAGSGNFYPGFAPKSNVASDIFAYNYRASVEADMDYNGGIWLGLVDTGYLLENSISDTDECVPSLAFSPNDSTFATAIGFGLNDDQYISDHLGLLQDSRNVIKLWDVKTHSELEEFHNKYYDAVASIAFSSDGSMLAASFAADPYRGGDGPGFEVWDVETGTVLYQSQNLFQSSEMWFLPGDSAVFLGDGVTYNLKPKQSTFIRVPTWDFPLVAMMPGDKQIAVTHQSSGSQDPPDSIQIMDIGSGNVTSTILLPDSEIVTCMAVNPATGDIAIGGQDLIVYKNPLPAEVEESSGPSMLPLRAFVSNRRISVRLSNGIPEGVAGQLYVYNALGQCVFSRAIVAGESSITTGALVSGNYFIAFKPEHGEAAFTKVSLIQ